MLKPERTVSINQTKTQKDLQAMHVTDGYIIHLKLDKIYNKRH